MSIPHAPFLLAATVALTACGPSKQSTGPRPDSDPAAELATLYRDYETRLVELRNSASLAWWKAANFGKPEDFKRVAATELAVVELNSDADAFAVLDRLAKGGQIGDPLQQRVLTVVHRAFAANQIEASLRKHLIDEATSLEQAFNTFRPTVADKAVTANQIAKVLTSSIDSDERKRYWEASKAIGPTLAERIRKLVHERNRAARALGYADYYEMQLRLSEQDPARIAEIFAEIDRTTAPLFATAKADIDARLAARYSISPAELRPWHYEDTFFQEPPGLDGLDLDAAFADLDPVKVTTAFFTDLGMPVASEILARSDLYERDGKVEHAFCADLDRAGDVRILANVKADEGWTATLLHELGHGVYDVYIDHELPFVLRASAHQLVTEGVAELFGTLTRDPHWLGLYTDMPAATRAEVGKLAREQTRLGHLVFSRWSLVVVAFERALYANPDQDLNQLWWQLVARYQKLTPPDDIAGRADWAAKIHIVTVPAYYHNYLLGELFAAQLRQRFAEVAPAAVVDGHVQIAGHPEIGKFLIDEVFVPGKRYPWEELVRRATGEPLSAAAFLAELAAE